MGCWGLVGLRRRECTGFWEGFCVSWQIPGSAARNEARDTDAEGAANGFW